jgi:hypothetical protein
VAGILCALLAIFGHRAARAVDFLRALRVFRAVKVPRVLGALG